MIKLKDLLNENSDKAKLYKLYAKAMKMMPGSPAQKKIKKEIEKLRNKLGLNEGPNLDKYYKKETKKVITKILRKNGYKPSKYHASGQVRGFGTMHTSSDFGYYFEREGLISLFGDEKELDKKIKKLKRELEKAGITVRDSGGEFLSYDSLSLKAEE